MTIRLRMAIPSPANLSFSPSGKVRPFRLHAFYRQESRESSLPYGYSEGEMLRGASGSGRVTRLPRRAGGTRASGSAPGGPVRARGPLELPEGDFGVVGGVGGIIVATTVVYLPATPGGLWHGL